jgi:hypothetical protein
MKSWIVAAVAFLSFFPTCASASQVLDSRTTLLIDENEPGPVQKAAADLARDWQRVLGQPIRVVHKSADAGPTTLCVALEFNLPKTIAKPSGWETFLLQTVSNPWPGSPAQRAVILTGSDVRGTIFAIYQFSQEFLGVDPFYWWTDHEPARRTQVALPDHLLETQGPVFRYRGFFVNDEDLFTGWKPGIPDGTGISLELWDHVFEAILRLKANMVLPGTWIFPYESQITAAVDRGLIVSQHHVNVLGLDTYQWPQDKKYSFTDAPQDLEAAMRRSISQYPKDAEIVWSVGYRGQNDYPFWRVDSNPPTTEEGRAQVIQKAIGREIEILKEQHPDAEIVLNAWQEAATFIHDGFLKAPPGVSLVWPDDGHGIIQDKGAIISGQGVYYHTAMFDGRSNHFSENVPLERIRQEMGRAARAGATEYFLVNTSNIRPVVMTTRAVMELAWNPKPWMATDTDEAKAYLHKWSREEFGEKAAPAVEKYYEAYFQAPAKYGDLEDAYMGDNFYESVSRALLMRLAAPNMTAAFPGSTMGPFKTQAEWAAYLEKQCRDANSRWETAVKLAEQAKILVPPDRQQFFVANTITQAKINLHGNRMLLDIAQAAQATAPADQLPLIQSAIQEGQQILEAFHAADYGKWDGFYTKGDWLLDVPRTLNLARAYVAQLQGKGMDQNALLRAGDGGFAYHMITAYQGTQKVQF